jgi:hypothetical protein
MSVAFNWGGLVTGLEWRRFIAHFRQGRDSKASLLDETSVSVANPADYLPLALGEPVKREASVFHARGEAFLVMLPKQRAGHSRRYLLNLAALCLVEACGRPFDTLFKNDFFCAHVCVCLSFQYRFGVRRWLRLRPLPSTLQSHAS